MKKIFILSIMAIIILMPLSGAVDVTKSSEEQVNPVVRNTSTEDFTHTVLAEFIGSDSCPHCPTANSQFNAIYNSGDYDFQYVSMVFCDDMNANVYGRIQELGTEAVPDAHFDSKYKNVHGKQVDEQPYRTAIVQSGEREVPDIGLNLDVEWKGGGTIKITVNVQNNEPEEYDGHLRVYITEIGSRWNDAQSNPYRFATLYIPIDKSLAVVSPTVVKQQGQSSPLDGDTYTFTKTWFGAIHGFGDITQDNIMVIASVFDSDTDYAVQTASAVPASSGAVPTSKTNGNGYTNITVQEAFETYLSCYCAGVQIPIDIRRQDEWDPEHIETYGDEQKPVHWPNLHLGEGLQEFMEEYADKEVVIYCRSGNRSWTATKLLIANGFTGTIYHMLGGINAWKDAGYPTAISVHKAYGLLMDTGNGIQTPVDVRTEEEWNKEHIDTPEPENPVLYADLHLGVGLNDFMTQYDDKEVILYCNTDGRSSDAVDILIEKIVAGEFNGYVHNMIGGMDAWKDAGYPTPTTVQLHSSPYSQTLYQVLLRLLGRSQIFFQTL